MKNNFNIIISGTGGQGLITLLQVLAEASIIEGYDVKTSELHGLSQRGGSVNVHVRIGDEINSPLIPKGSADLILSLEYLETLRNISFANSETVFLVNCYSLPFVGTISEKAIDKELEKVAKKNKYIVAASEICRKELSKDVLSGIYLLSFASFNNLIPIKPKSIEKAIKKVIPKNYLDINLKAYKLADKHGN